jgi:hypothetical protein
MADNKFRAIGVRINDVVTDFVDDDTRYSVIEEIGEFDHIPDFLQQYYLSEAEKAVITPVENASIIRKSGLPIDGRVYHVVMPNNDFYLYVETFMNLGTRKTSETIKCAGDECYAEVSIPVPDNQSCLEFEQIQGTLESMGWRYVHGNNFLCKRCAIKATIKMHQDRIRTYLRRVEDSNATIINLEKDLENL